MPMCDAELAGTTERKCAACLTYDRFFFPCAFALFSSALFFALCLCSLGPFNISLQTETVDQLIQSAKLRHLENFRYQVTNRPETRCRRRV
mmetsp:Transcript_74503/g.199157  ORF Transcript_74503/g.199157 Transcript_74503/m.199157 type:complete len:91 (-) Transcript_74503:145-417(-)